MQIQYLKVLRLQLLRLNALRLQIEDKPGLFALANADLLLRRVLKAALGNLDNVVLEFEIRQAQLAGVSELRLKFSVEKNSGVVLTGDDQERAQIVVGLRERLILDRMFLGRLISARDSSRGSVGRNTRSRHRRLGSCLCRGRFCGSRLGRSCWCWHRDGGNSRLCLRRLRSVMFSREEKSRCHQDDRGGRNRNQDQRCGVRPGGLFCLGSQERCWG